MAFVRFVTRQDANPIAGKESGTKLSLYTHAAKHDQNDSLRGFGCGKEREPLTC